MPSPIALTPYSPFFLSGLIPLEDNDRSYLDLASPSLKRKPSSLHSAIQPPRLRHCPSSSANSTPSASLRTFPELQPAPSRPPPTKPLGKSRVANLPLESRQSISSTVPSSYKRRKRTDALAALEGRNRLARVPSSRRNFMSMTDDEDEDEDDDLDDVDAAEYYGRLVSVTTQSHPTSQLSSLNLPLIDISHRPISSDLETEDLVLPPSSPQLAQVASRPAKPYPVPKLTIPSPMDKPRDARVSFLPLSPSSSSSSFAQSTSIASQSLYFPFASNVEWDEIPFLTPFTLDDIDCDFSLPHRPAPTPDNYSPPRPTRRSEDDLPFTEEFSRLKEQDSFCSGFPSHSRTHVRTRTFSTPTRTSSRRTKKKGSHHLKSFIEFDRSSLASSKQSHHHASFWSKDIPLPTA